MKKQSNFFAACILAVLLMGIPAACIKQQESGTAALQQEAEKPSPLIRWEESDIAAAAFAGYFSSAEALKKSEMFSRLAEMYGFDKNGIPIIENEGSEVYLIIPRDPNAAVAVNSYPAENIINPENIIEGKILYRSEYGNPFFVKCSSGGGLVNTQIFITDSEPNGIEYFPALSIADGTLMVHGLITESSRTINDITPPLPKSVLPAEVDRPDDTISAFISRSGQVNLYVKQAAGALTDGVHTVEGISGRCIGLFTGDIGQNINPFLCMLMEDGGVHILSYRSVIGKDALIPGHFLASGRLPGLKNIVSFKQGAVTDEYGSGYTTIFAVDKDGKEYEIETCAAHFFPLYHFEKAEGSTAEYILVVYDDWKIEYKSGWYLSELNESYFGRISPLTMDYENGIFEYAYEMIEHNVYSEEGEPSVTEKPVTGSFRLRITGRGHELSVLSGPISFGANGTEEVYYSDSPEPEEE